MPVDAATISADGAATSIDSPIPAESISVHIDTPETAIDASASGANSYFRRDTTNDADFLIRSTLDALEERLFIAQSGDDEAEGGSGEGVVGVRAVLKEFDSLLAMYPSSPRAAWGRARCLDELADLERNNALLEEGIAAYEKVVDDGETPTALFLMAGKRLVNRLQFRGRVGSAIKVRE